MIRRNIRKKDVPVEKLIKESSFNFKGIDVSSPPQSFNTVEDMDNFDVGLDGALALRKPLLLKETHSANELIFYLYDNSLLKITVDAQYNVTSFYINNTSYTNYKGISGEDLIDPYLGKALANLKVINTNTSSILVGVYFNVNVSNVNGYRDYAKEYLPTQDPIYVPLPIKIIKTEGNTGLYNLTVLKPETPEMYVDPDTFTTKMYFNLLNYYPYSLQDDYKSIYTKIHGILMYKLNYAEFPASVNPEYYTNNNSIERLMESKEFYIADMMYKDEPRSHKCALKAFLDVDTTSDNLYCTWEMTHDGSKYVVVDKIGDRSDAIDVDVTDYSKSYETLDDDGYKPIRKVKYVKLKAYRPDAASGPYFNFDKTDLVSDRPDVLVVDPQVKYTYRFSIRSVIEKVEDDGNGGTVTKQYSTELAFATYKIIYTDINESITSSALNVNSYLESAKTLYYNYRTWYFGKDLKNTIYFSDVDSLTVTAENSLTLSTDETVTSLTPWRNYLIATTANKIFLIYKLSDGYAFKVINTFIGIDEANARTCKAILNSIIFKSGAKIFTLQPNPYGSDDTILNIADISKPIASLLVDGTNNFAISTEQYYYVFIPLTTTTVMFKYDYSRKTWVKHIYPIVFKDYHFENVDDIYLIDISNKIYYFEKDIDFYKVNQPTYIDSTFDGYGDFLNTDKTVTPITFTIDFGQKASNIQFTKRYSELKMILENLNITDNKSITSQVYIDGIFLAKEQQTLTEDVNTDDYTDGSADDVLTLNTNIVNASGSDIKRLRQIILRFLAKGKTIRYHINGSTMSNFKIYSVSYRYRIPHVKQ